MKILDRKRQLIQRSAKIVALLGLLWLSPHSVTPAAALPAKIPMPNEFATLVLNEPWDMHYKENIPHPYQGIQDDQTHPYTTPSGSGYIWTATINSTGVTSGVGLYLVAPGFKGGLPLMREGNSFMRNNKVDTSKYHYLSFSMNYTGSNSPIVAVYGTDGWDDFAADPAVNYAAVGWITITPGSHNYLVDISTLSYLNTGRNWTDLKNKTLTGLRLLLVNGQAGTNIQFNWIRLTDASYNTSSTLNNPTRLQFTAPSYTSGEDYATATRGSAWDMNNSADIWTTNPPWDGGINLTSFSFNNSATGCTSVCANFQNTSNDPRLYLKGPENIPINSSKYRYFTYRYWIEGTWDLTQVGGWAGRVIWFGPGGYGTDQAITSQWYLREGWNTYNIDLAAASLDPSSLSTWTSVQPHTLRITPNEGTLSQTMHLDYVRLTARDTTDASYTIRWNTINPDNNTVSSIALYYDTDQNSANGGRTLITTLLNSNPGSYVWNTSGLSNGQVLYISADVNDGYNTTTWYSEAPLVITHLGPYKEYIPLIIR